MKANIHPKVYKVVFLDTSNGSMYKTESTSKSDETLEIDGETYYVIKVETSSSSHPFYTGTQKAASKGGQVDKFLKKKQLAAEKQEQAKIVTKKPRKR